MFKSHSNTGSKSNFDLFQVSLALYQVIPQQEDETDTCKKKK